MSQYHQNMLSRLKDGCEVSPCDFLKCFMQSSHYLCNYPESSFENFLVLSKANTIGIQL